MHKFFSNLIALVCMQSVIMVFSQKTERYLMEKQKISQTLDDLNNYAAQADFIKYFDLFADESVFIGTDATEIWTKPEFMKYAKPHFDNGKAWTFKTVKRNITVSKNGKLAWFDEILDTQMKICRGSGVLEKIGNRWKIRQYILSMTVPNEVSRDVVRLKTDLENKVLESWSGNKK